VTIFIFNWANYQEDNLDWRAKEIHIVDMLRKHSESWQRDTSVVSKFMVLVLWPNKEYGQGLSMDECKNSLRRTLSVCEDYISKSAVYFLPNGLDQLKNI
jgi:hypothetical protein